MKLVMNSPAGRPLQEGSLARQFYQNDLFLQFLRDGYRIGPGWYATLVAILAVFVLVILPAVFNAPLNTQGTVVSLIQGVLIMPLGAVLYLQIPDILANLFTSLWEKDVVGDFRGQTRAGTPEGTEPRSAYAQFLGELTGTASQRRWLVLSLASVAGYWYYRLFSDVPGDTTNLIPPDQRLWLRLALLVVYSPILFGATSSLARLMIGLNYTNRLFKQFKIRVNPMNPDGAGGLGGLGRLLIGSVLIATALGAAAAGMVIANMSSGFNQVMRVEVIALGAIYLLYTPVLFSVWLWAPHQALLEAREDALKPLADEYLRASGEVLPGVEESAGDIKAKTDRLLEIKRQYELIRDTFPTWPLPDRTIKNLVATSSLPALSPFLTGILASLSDLLFNLFRGGRP
jgi:hypothetical protein